MAESAVSDKDLKWQGAARLDDELTAAGWTNVALAKKLGWSDSTVSRHRSGERAPSQDDLAKIFAAAEFTPTQILRVLVGPKATPQAHTLHKPPVENEPERLEDDAVSLQKCAASLSELERLIPLIEDLNREVAIIRDQGKALAVLVRTTSAQAVDHVIQSVQERAQAPEQAPPGADAVATPKPKKRARAQK